MKKLLRKDKLGAAPGPAPKQPSSFSIVQLYNLPMAPGQPLDSLVLKGCLGARKLGGLVNPKI